MTKPRKIYLKNVNVSEITNHEGKFSWSFKDYEKNLTVVLELDRWWINFLADDLWKVMTDEQNAIDKLKKHMKGDSE